MSNKLFIKDLGFNDLEQYLVDMGEKKFRAKQIMDEIYLRRIDNFKDATTLPAELRDRLDEYFEINSISISKKRISKDGSVKYLFSLKDNYSVEAVYMPWFDESGENIERVSLCISSMAGCPVGCAFCATGTLGFQRNLSAAEIIDQILLVEKDLNCKIKNIVYMGMGEPLMNYNNVVKSIEIMADDRIKLISRKRITLSTSGVAPRVKQLAKEKYPVKLAISLHATTNGLREKLMPISKSFPIQKLMDAVEEYYRETKMGITYEYILFEGLNDTDEDIKRLTKIARRVPSRVNVIPFNDISFTGADGFVKELKPASKENMKRFADKLRQNKIPVILRDTFGSDIEAACGQLALSEE